MSPEERLTAFGEQVGFDVRVEPDVVRAIMVPCLLKDGVAGTCTIEKSCDPDSGKPNDRIGGDVHAVQITTDAEIDGLVYHADGTPVGNQVGGDARTWSSISIRRGSQGSPEEDGSAFDVVHRYAKHIVGAVSAAGYSEPTALAMSDPFHIPNTFETRAAIAPVQDRIRGQRIAIIGLGGTGAYLLDVISKTPVSEIHLLDSDCVDWHTLKRAPGAPTAEEIEQVRSGTLLKVHYYHSKYGAFRAGIHPHPVRVDSPSMFSEFVSDHAIDYTFVCIDQLTDGDSARQDAVYRAVTEAGVPFIDSGVSITLEGCTVRGAVTTSAYDAGSDAWKDAIPNARLVGGAPGYRNVQLPEVNAAAAAFAVMEWRRRTGQYVSETPSFYQKYRLERGYTFYASVG
ncbi:MAG: ThiF family adenylyltransferase [Gemmatimonadaceae bacterium]|nr:ThiF family adenylyltransferase [Gemmatimonadaceae bacterium]